MNEVTVPDSPAGSHDLLLHQKDPDTRVGGGYVCFRYATEHRRGLVNKLWSGCSGLRDSAGTGAHGWIPILSWDRPADEAVAQMNTWLSHARPS